MPFCPGIPYDQVVPSMCPSYHKQVQGIVIVNMHTIVVDASMDTATGIGPSSQLIFGIRAA
jgi:hypothetical protein